MAEALDGQDRDAVGALLLARQEVAGAEAVADGADADSDGVDGDLEERVEGDDLVHLSAPDVHAVGDRVRELGRDRPDLAADPPEVVEEPGALGRELLEQRGEG